MNKKSKKNRLARKLRTGGPVNQKQKRQIFEDLVTEALTLIPKKFRRALKNMSIIIEDRPSTELLQEIGYDPDEMLLGLYVGVPLPERTFGDDPYLPDCIFIFRKPLESLCSSPDELREQIRITVIHELAHYFGFDEERLEELGLG